MNISKQASLLFHGIEIVQTNYSSKKRYSKDLKVPIDLNITPKVFYPKDNKKAFSIIMEANIYVDKYFELEIAAVGHFELNGEITSEIKLTFINTSAPAIMFPYLRSFISTFTSSVGIASGTLIIPPQFFSGKLETLEEEENFSEEE